MPGFLQGGLSRLPQPCDGGDAYGGEHDRDGQRGEDEPPGG